MKRGLCVAFLGALLLGAVVGAQQPPYSQATGLTFFKNYFITGDYVVGGVNLRGTGDATGMATGTIDLTGADIPTGAELAAAFLYWETVSTTGSGAGFTNATFQGNVDPSAMAFDSTKRNDITGLVKVLNPAGTAPCWSSGGGTGSADGAHLEFTYRADVLRFIPLDPASGRRVVKTHFEVRLPDAGSGNKVPSTAGATLVVVYKDPSKPLSSIVIYDGGHSMNNSTQYMNRTLAGFYQAGTNDPTKKAAISAKMTHIVGDGSAAKSEVLYFGSGANATTQLGAQNPFQGLSANPNVTPIDPAWDNVTTDVSANVSQDASAVTTRVDHELAGVTFTPFDCLTWGAIIFKTTVQDSDNDGLLDVWESPQDPNNPLKDPNGRQLPNLSAMGAKPNHKDVFVELGAMKTGGYTTPFQGTVDGHDHGFHQAALDLVGDAFKNAPIANGDGVGGISIHFDVGNQFQTDPYVIKFMHPNPVNPNKNTACTTPPAPNSTGITTTDADCWARGGEEFDENFQEACNADPNNNTCLFKSYPGTVGWKRGFRALRDEPLNYDTEAACQNAEFLWTQYRTGMAGIPAIPDCIRRFDHQVRKDMFHYVLSVHGIGYPRIQVDANGQPIIDPATGQPKLLLDATGSQIPRNVSGISDGGGIGGGDAMVALGFWDTFIGTDFMQASTLMHEIGHNFRFGHGGAFLVDANTGKATSQQNCKSNYESVMSYLFQMSGLVCDPTSTSPQCTGKPSGFAVVDYSRQALGTVNGVLTNPLSENSLTEQNPPELSGMVYRTRWFSPTSALDVQQGTPTASRHCDGTFLLPNEAGEYRIDGTSLTSVDWNGNLTIDSGNVGPQNINFVAGPNGLGTPTDGPFAGFNDWANIDLRQIGGRRNVTGLGGLLSVDQTEADSGQNDAGQNDAGQNDAGQNDAGQNDAGQNDAGQNDAGAPLGEADLDTARALDNRVTLLTPVVTKAGIVLTWMKPHVDSNFVTDYLVYRVTGTVVNQATLATKILVTANPVAATSLTVTDTTAKNNTFYTYWVQAQFSIDNKGVACPGQSCGLSGVSNFQTIFDK